MASKITKENYAQFLTDMATFDEENIRYIKPLLFYTVARSMGVYYQSAIDQGTFRKQKIIFETPLMVVPFEISAFENDNNIFYNMSLSFASVTKLYNEDEIKQTHSFIRKIDTVTEETISDNIKRWGLPKNIQFRKTLKRIQSDQPHFMNVSIPYCPEQGVMVRCLDAEGRVASLLDTIKKRSVVKAVIELTDVIFTRDKYWLNYTLLQIRRHKPYSATRHFFLNVSILGDSEEKPVAQSKPRDIPKPPPMPVKIEPMSRNPHVDPKELQKVLKKLKPVK